ncbi:hypothetical protein [Yinghuangia sp. YIM S09857]|uniref:hypothetical protein n=1 Tax=Yinghuangia sp. YIM S09857 TaxID=3436929 RepID=UPI003F530ED2
MSSSGLIYAAIVGAWAAYLVPMWLRRQDELNEARHTERFTTAIRILSRRGALERRYARMIANGDDGLATASVSLDAPARERRRGAEGHSRDGAAGSGHGRDARDREGEPHGRETPSRDSRDARDSRDGRDTRDNTGPQTPSPPRGDTSGRDTTGRDPQGRDPHARESHARDSHARDTQGREKPPPAAPPEQGDSAPRRRDVPAAQAPRARQVHAPVDETGRPGPSAGAFDRSRGTSPAARSPHTSSPPASTARQPEEAPAEARRRFGLGRRTAPAVTVKPPAPLKGPDGRAKLLARRRRVVVCLFLLFTGGAVVTGMLGLAWIWAPVLPGIALTGYIAYLRVQERRRYEANLRNQLRPTPPARPAPPRPARKTDGEPRRTATPQPDPPARRRTPDGSAPPRSGQARGATPPASAQEPRARSGRRSAADERDHAEWIAALQSDSGQDAADRDAWDPVPVPLPTYVTAPVVPRGEPALPERPEPATPEPVAADPTPLFDQYAEDPRRAPQYPPYEQDWPRAGNE